MNFLFWKKKSEHFLRLSKAFPKEFALDVEVVCNAMSTKSNAYSDALFCDENTEWNLPSGEKIKIPYRIYVGDGLILGDRMTERQKLIYHCIFSRSYNGYVRQKHIEALLASDLPDWAIP